MSYSKPVLSNQTEIYDNLVSVVQKHLRVVHQKPYPVFSLAAFEKIQAFTGSFSKRPILDSGCGTAMSCLYLLEKYPEHPIVAIDKSAYRLEKGKKRLRQHKEAHRVLFVQADIFDMWELAKINKIYFHRHFLFYPNPWPLKKHFRRRVYGHPAFRILFHICKHLEVRTNWKLYLDELSLSIEQISPLIEHQIMPVSVNDQITHFEQKYQTSGHRLWKLMTS